MYAIKQRIEENFGAYTMPSFGAIKPALTRLEKSNAITSSKIISDGGKVSIFYSITKEGEKELKKRLLKPLSTNPVQFFTDARLKLSCLSVLEKDECEDVLVDIKTNALFHKLSAEKIIKDEYTPLTHYQQVVFDNTICEYTNFISLIEGLEKSNAGNS